MTCLVCLALGLYQKFRRSNFHENSGSLSKHQLCIKGSRNSGGHILLEVERAGAQLVFWLELGELSQLGSAQLTILNLLASSAQLSSPF